MLQELSKHFEIVVFTSGIKTYMNKIMDILDPEGKIISHGFSREYTSPNMRRNCHQKDLTCLLSNRLLKDVIIIDNKEQGVTNFENLIPIQDYEGEESVNTLKYLKNYLLSFKGCADVRPLILADFQYKAMP